MSILVVEEAVGISGEKQVVFTDESDDPKTTDRLVIHPWNRDYRNIGKGVHDQVCIQMGDLNELGNSISDDFCIVILDRHDFVEGLLEVLPELKRA